MEGHEYAFARFGGVPIDKIRYDNLNSAVTAVLFGRSRQENDRWIGNRSTSVAHDFAVEKMLLAPLPAEPFDTALTLTPRVDRYAQVMVRCNQYSVPARFIGHRLRVKLSASMVTAYDRNQVVARHQRAIGKGAKVLDLDHYLEILARKPGALPGATALAQARAAKVFTAAHDRFWAAARKAHGDAGHSRVDPVWWTSVKRPGWPLG